MPILHAIVLGLTQGLSEFLPISSSGHLILVPWLFGWHELDRDPSLNKAFDAILHLGTLLAALSYFRKDLMRYVPQGLRAIFKRSEEPTPDGRLAVLLLVSAIPAAIVGAVAEKVIEEHLGQIPLIAIMLIVFGLVLLWADRLGGDRGVYDYRLRDALLTGGAQILALSPGVSRSGSTITMSRYLNFDRDAAARLSFLMSVPVTGGAALYKLAKLLKDGVPDGLGGALIVGVIAAAISGWIAVWGTIRLVRTRSFAPFVIYRVMVGAGVLILCAAQFRT